MIYTPAQLAAALHVSPQTLRRWSGAFASALSPGAAPGPGLRRNYTDGDLVLLRHAKGQLDAGRPLAEVAAALPTIAPMDDTPPASAVATIPDSARELWTNTMHLWADQEAEIARLQSDLAALADRLEALEKPQNQTPPLAGFLARIFRRRS